VLHLLPALQLLPVYLLLQLDAQLRSPRSLLFFVLS
jgi:hypothetical protein